MISLMLKNFTALLVKAKIPKDRMKRLKKSGLFNLEKIQKTQKKFSKLLGVYQQQENSNIRQSQKLLKQIQQVMDEFVHKTLSFQA